MFLSQGVPGPGKYDLLSQFNNPGALVMGDAIEPPPFGCSQQVLHDDLSLPPR